jgi:hypothetical protein
MSSPAHAEVEGSRLTWLPAPWAHQRQANLQKSTCRFYIAPLAESARKSQ